MATSNIITVQLTGVGGAAPYTFQAPSSSSYTSLPAGTYSVSGSSLTVNATTLLPGEYTVYVIVTDNNLNTSSQIINVTVVPSDIFLILNNNQYFEPVLFPYTATIPLMCSGQMGTGAASWGLIPTVTTMPGAAISGSSLTFTLTSFGSWEVGVTATDSFGNTVSKVLVFEVLSSAVYQLIDGQIELKLNAPPSKIGVQSFTLAVQDNASNIATQTFNYTVTSPVSDVDIEEYCFDHYWGAGDTTTVTLPIFGDLSGFSLGAVTLPTLSNGLVATLDNVNGVVLVSGPPTSFKNAELYIPIAVMQGGNQVATITREYTLLSHNGTTTLGQYTCYTRPYLVGDTVGLNPLKPYFNSPTVSKPAGTVVSIPVGYFLPPGLSLDANTGLIYGTVVGVFSGNSILQYTDSTNALVGTVTIIWDINQSTFALQDNLTDGQIQQTYSGALTVSGTSSSPLASFSVYSGRLPLGLSFTINPNGQTLNLAGTPQEAGQFDVWIKVTNSAGNSSFIYHRILIYYIPVLTIVTTSLPPMTTGVFYQQVLQGFGGVQPYTWALGSSSPALPTGITLSSSGVLSGTPSSTSYSQTLVINLVDSRSPSVTVSQRFPITISNNLQITTTAIPNITPGLSYSFSFTAQGGSGSYTWALPSSGFTLPSGFSFNPATGVLSGLFSGVPTPNYSSSVTVTVTSGTATASKSFTLATGVSELLIDTSEVGLVNRGVPYQGVLRAFNAVQPPVQWQVTPTSSSPLPPGLTLQANSADNGVTAFISGTTVVKADGTTGYPQIPVTVSAVDSANNSAQAILLLTTYSNLAISTHSLPIATVGSTNPYSVTLAATGGASPYTWSIDPSSPTSTTTLAADGFTLASSGVLSGTGTVAAAPSVTFRVTDCLTPADYDSQNYTFNIVSSTLAIFTTELTPAEAGRAYSMQLVATGGTGTYIWSITGGTLPFSLNPNTGVISGTTQVAGTFPLTITVYDTINVVSASLPLVVNNGLTLFSGIDYTDGTSLQTLGYVSTTGSVASINQNPDLAFYVVATGVVSTSASTITVTLPTGFSYNITSLSGGVAEIQLLGGFNTYTPGSSNYITVSVNDAGVVATSSFSWTVYNDGSLSVAPTNTLPIRTLE